MKPFVQCFQVVGLAVGSFLACAVVFVMCPAVCIAALFACASCWFAAQLHRFTPAMRVWLGLLVFAAAWWFAAEYLRRGYFSFDS